MIHLQVDFSWIEIEFTRLDTKYSLEMSMIVYIYIYIYIVRIFTVWTWHLMFMFRVDSTMRFPRIPAHVALYYASHSTIVCRRLPTGAKVLDNVNMCTVLRMTAQYPSIFTLPICSGWGATCQPALCACVDKSLSTELQLIKTPIRFYDQLYRYKCCELSNQTNLLFFQISAKLACVIPTLCWI